MKTRIFKCLTLIAQDLEDLERKEKDAKAILNKAVVLLMDPSFCPGQVCP